MRVFVDRARRIAPRCRKVIDKVQAWRRGLTGAGASSCAAAFRPVATLLIAGITLLVAATPLAAQPVAAVGPDAAACAQGSTALLVRVTGFRDRSGLVRVSTYAATPEAWLARGKFLRRIDMPVPTAGDVHVCVALAAPARLGVAVLHDRNGDHHANIFSDGGGFSNNPALGLSKPAVEQVAFAAGAGVTVVDIRLKYL